MAKGDAQRHDKQFHIECPVTVTVQAKGKWGRLAGREFEGRTFEGKLRDVGLSGARFYLDRALAVGTRLTLDAHFPGKHKSTTTVRFEGVVTVAEKSPRHEIAVEFSQSGSFLRGDLRKILALPASAALADEEQ